ncbi:MAG: hypothetical protein AB4426_13825 [Xenococcaceae cyanobacterium]
MLEEKKTRKVRRGRIFPELQWLEEKKRLSCIYGDKQRLSNERAYAVSPYSRIIPQM